MRSWKMAELGFKCRQSGSRALDDDATLPLKRPKTLIYYSSMPGNRRINLIDFFKKKKKKEEEER